MKPITIAYITAREEPCFDWFVESLEREVNKELGGKWGLLRVIVVDSLRNRRKAFVTVPGNAIHCLPKPTTWQGKERLTKQDWWAAANARNTAICLCETEWIAFLDDRSVILPGWLNAIEEAQKGRYVVAGSYEKRTGMTCISGIIRHAGIVIGEDSREEHRKKVDASIPMNCGGEWLFGCNFALPLEWALEVNGQDEFCDGLGTEDCMFGIHLQNANKPIKFDPRMKIVEDRTPSAITGSIIRRDKGVSPNDKSHAMVDKLKGLSRASHPHDLRKIRHDALKGYGFPKATWPTHDWYDGQPLGEMVPG